MPFWLSILRCAEGSYYTGHTDNLEMRVAAHHRGELSRYTASRQPVRLVFTEEFATREEAFQCERRVKAWSRAKKEALIRADWNRLKGIAPSRRSPARQPCDLQRRP